MNQVIIYTHEFYPKKGGIATVVEEVAYALHEQGKNVEVFAPRIKENKGTLKQFPFSIFPLNNQGTQGWGCRLVTMISLFKNRKKIKESILYLPEPGPLRAMFYLSLLNLIQAKRIIVTLHGSEIIRLTCWPFNRWLMGSFLSKNVHRISVLSNYCRELLLKQFPKLEEKTVICGPGVRREIIPTQGRKEFNKDKIVLLTVARIHPRKGQLLVLKAIKKLQEEISLPIHYWIVGPEVDKHYAKKLKEFASEYSLNVTFYGDLEETALNKCYDAADIFIMMSEPYKKSVEGYGLVYLEAMAKGLPVLAKETGGVGECVKRDSRNVLIREKSGEDEVVEGLKQMIEGYLEIKIKEDESAAPKIASWQNFALKTIAEN